MKKINKPGETCSASGQYAIVRRTTGRPIGVERTVVRGEPFPPTPSAGLGFVLVDRTITKKTR